MPYALIIFAAVNGFYCRFNKNCSEPASPWRLAKYNKLIYDKLACAIFLFPRMCRLELAVVLYKLIEGDGMVAVQIYTGVQ